jgi:hypothetical protein
MGCGTTLQPGSNEVVSYSEAFKAINANIQDDYSPDFGTSAAFVEV